MFAFLRLLLAAAVALQPALAWAACAIDGQPPATGTTYDPGTTTRTLIFTTTQPNDIIIFPISAVSETNITYSFPNVVSIVCTSGCTSPPTFTRRFQHQDSVVGCWLHGTCYIDTEEWSAVSAMPLPSVTLTVTIQMDLGYANLKPFGVHGASGFDANGSLTASQEDLSGATSTIEVSGFSTTSSPDFLIFSCDTAIDVAPGGCAQANAAGFATINAISQQNIFAGFGLNSKVLTKGLAAPVSGITLQPISLGYRFWFAWADALVCNAGSAFPQVQILE